MEDRGNAIFISLAALWEMGIKAANGKLPFYSKLIENGSTDVVARLQKMNVALLGIELDEALAAIRLPQHHRDPFDRLMISQAIHNDLIVITTDEIFSRYTGLRVLQA